MEKMGTFSFFIVAILWGLFLISGLESPGVPLALTSVALFIFAPFFGRIVSLLASVPFYFFGILLTWVESHSFEIYLSLLALLALHLYRTSGDEGEPLVIMTTIALELFWFQLNKDAGNAPLAAVFGGSRDHFPSGGPGPKNSVFPAHWPHRPQPQAESPDAF